MGAPPCERIASQPTAIQASGELHDTPVSAPPSSSGGRAWIVHVLPSQASMYGLSVPWLSLAAPLTLLAVYLLATRPFLN